MRQSYADVKAEKNQTMLNFHHLLHKRSAHSTMMKTTSFQPGSALLCLLVCGLLHAASAAWAQTPTDATEATGKTMRAGIAKVVSGEVRVLGAQGVRPLASGDSVFSGDRLLSGKYGLASVVLRDGTTLVLGNSSQLQIQNFAFNATTAEGNMLLSVLQGSVRVVTGLISKINPDALQVRTNTLLVGIRGTDFIIETEEPFSFLGP